MSCSKVVSFEMLFLELAGLIFLSSIPLDIFHIVLPKFPKLFASTFLSNLRKSSIVIIEFFSNFFLREGPIPGIFLTCKFLINSNFSDFPITVKPLGFSNEDASFARNLFSLNPIEMVIPNCFSISSANSTNNSAGAFL